MDEDATFALSYAPKLSDLPSGISSAPFTWVRPDGPRALALYAGHVGAAIEGGAVRPRMAYWIGAAEPLVRRFDFVDMNGVAVASPRSAELEDLSGFAEEAEAFERVGLSLSWCPKLRTLEGVPPSLETLNVLECNELTSLAPLAGASYLASVHLAQCARLTDIAALARCTELRSLAIVRCPRVTGLSAIAELPALETLSLWHLDALPASMNGQFVGRDAVRACRPRYASVARTGPGDDLLGS